MATIADRSDFTLELEFTGIYRENESAHRAVREAPAYIEELFRLSREKRMLSERWNRTYNG